MSEISRLMNFEEFRAAAGEPFGEALRQQREFFRSDASAEQVLRPGALAMVQWADWPPTVDAIPAAV